MGALDLIRMGKTARPRSKTGSGATNINNGIITIPLERTWLVKEHRVRVQVAQSFTGVPTSSDVRRFFKSVQLVVDKGDGIKLNFHAAYDLFRATIPNAPAPRVTLGASSTADFSFELHHANDGAIGELLTSLLSGKYSTLELQIELSADATNGFIGGTVPGVAAYSVEVYPTELRQQTPSQRDDQSGGWGVADHSAVQLSNIKGDVSGVEADVDFKGGNLTRFLIMHAFDAATLGSLTDAVFVNGATISMEINGTKVFENTSLSFLKQVMADERKDLGTGVLLIDMGDDPNMWIDTRNVPKPQFKLSVPASASLPAAWRVELAQDYTKMMEDSRIPSNLRA